jgi:hypothetical protein
MNHPRRRWTSAAVAVALTASTAAAAFASIAPAVHAATTSRAALAAGGTSATLSGSEDPLGVNTATWDSNFTDSSVAGTLSNAGLGLIRFPGGSSADLYNWQSTSGVDFAQYSKQVNAISNGQKLVTVNYGTGTPQEAAAWVTQSQSSGEGVSLWEVGNEEYGSWEADNHTDPHTPSSYASNALPFMQAIKGADANAKICFDYGLDGSLSPGSGANNWQDWDNTILQADHSYINCADVHWYPINGLPSESVESIMNTVNNIPTAAGEVHSELSTYDPSADFIVGETNISEAANPWNEEPVGALFSAATAMEWLSYGAHSVDWWDVHNDGSSSGDFGLLSSGTSGEGSLAVKGATVGTLPLSQSNAFGYYSDLPNGSHAIMLVNADPSSSFSVSTASVGMGSSGTEYTYDNANPSISTASFSGDSISVPAESVVVLTSSGGSAPSPTASASTSPSTSPTTSPSTSPTTSPSPTTSTPVSSGSGAAEIHALGAAKCLEDPNWSEAEGTQQDIWGCNGGGNQNWTTTSSRELKVTVEGSTFCLDADGQKTTPGTKVQIWACNGGANQQWNVNSNGTITGVQSGLCLDVTAKATANGSPVEIWTCNGGSNQQWSR